MNSKVDKYLENVNRWQNELKKLRTIILDCGLTEEFKWMHPCYTYQKKNIVLIHGFKAYCALLFHKGALLKDTNHLLVQQTENVQAARQFRFTNAMEIEKLEPTIKTYIFEAIGIEKAGLQIKMKQASDFDIPDELQQKFEKNPDFQDAFEALTTGRQKGYVLYFSKPKQSKTRTARIDQYTERIMNGKGLRDCICGHSKRLPNCDGSHRYIGKHHQKEN